MYVLFCHSLLIPSTPLEEILARKKEKVGVGGLNFPDSMFLTVEEMHHQDRRDDKPCVCVCLCMCLCVFEMLQATIEMAAGSH